METFYTIQGEGQHSGEPAYFIRLGGCDVGCVWCDVKESWEAGKHPLLAIDALVDLADRFPAKNVVVTGGEPLMYNLDEFCNLLRLRKINTWLETSGAYPLSGSWDWICVSPKKFKAPLPGMLSKANELKVIVYNSSDFKWAEEQALHTSSECVLLLQPEWEKRDKMMPLIVEYVKEHPRWKISLQTHKYLNIP